MKLPLLVVTIVVLSLIACNGPTKSTPGIGSENTLTETPEYTGVIISEDGASEFGYRFDEASTEFWEPSTDDVARAEACIRQYLNSLQLNPELDPYQQENLAFILNNLETYRRQYVGISVEGEKRIWVNAFFSADSFPNWERVPVDVDGGGNHFWQVEYDLSTDDCTHFYVHGES
jgi:hypothetical protein